MRSSWAVPYCVSGKMSDTRNASQSECITIILLRDNGRIKYISLLESVRKHYLQALPLVYKLISERVTRLSLHYVRLGLFVRQRYSGDLRTHWAVRHSHTRHVKYSTYNQPTKSHSSLVSNIKTRFQ